MMELEGGCKRVDEEKLHHHHHHHHQSGCCCCCKCYGFCQGKNESSTSTTMNTNSKKELVVRCSVPPEDASSFPRLAVARKIIHTHTSAPFYVSSTCCISDQNSRGRAATVILFLIKDLLDFLEDEPRFLGRGSQMFSSSSTSSQVFLRDAAAALPSTSMCTESAMNRKEVASTVKQLNEVKDGLSNAFRDPSVPNRPSLTTSSSGLSSLAAEDGLLSAAELVNHFKTSLCPTCLRDDWDTFLASQSFDEFLFKLKASVVQLPGWITDPFCFRQVIKKVSKTKLPNQHQSIEDLLQSIASFEKAGLIKEMDNVGFVEHASVLRDRTVFFDLLAKNQVLQEASNVLIAMREEMGLPTRLSWIVACSNDQRRECLKDICRVCGFVDQIKTFAWKLDKLEFASKDCSKKQIMNACPITVSILKLLSSPLTKSLARICEVSHFETAICLFRSFGDIMEIIHRHS